MRAGGMTSTVHDNPALNRFELPIDGETAILVYERAENSIRLLHTEVPEAFRGRGFGEALVRDVLDRARAEGLRVVPVCPFVRAYLKKYPEPRI